MQNFEDLIKEAKTRGKKRIAVAEATDDATILALKKACQDDMATVFLVGKKSDIEAKLKQYDFTKGIEDILDFSNHADIALNAVKLVSCGKADMLMKGLIHTDILLHAVLDKEFGLRTGKILSHTFVVKVSAYPKLLLITDAAMNIAPSLADKKGILQNSIDLATKVGIKNIKAAVLGAVEEVNEKMQATIDAAILSKMADRKQIKGALVDGPLAFDNAISKRAAEEKGIVSQVAGDADILLVPEIVTGNVLFKALAYFADSKLAGVIMGAKAPIILTSRADTQETKFNSIMWITTS